MLVGIVDTGASAICMDSRVPLDLGLTPANKKLMQMADGTTVQSISYRGVLEIVGLGFKDWVEVFGIPMEYPSDRVLIGRSFLKRYLVNYSGPDELFHFYDASTGYSNHYEALDG